MSAIKAVRERLKLTQTELAKILDISQGSISFYEQGSIQMPPQTAAAFISYAGAHGVKVSFDDIYREAKAA